MSIEEKYADRVAPEHRIAMEAIGLVRMALAPHREQFEKLVEAERQMHSIGHILDPTLYRDMSQSKNFALQLRLVQAALAFLKAVDEIAKEIGA